MVGTCCCIWLFICLSYICICLQGPWCSIHLNLNNTTRYPSLPRLGPNPINQSALVESCVSTRTRHLQIMRGKNGTDMTHSSRGYDKGFLILTYLTFFVLFQIFDNFFLKLFTVFFFKNLTHFQNSIFKMLTHFHICPINCQPQQPTNSTTVYRWKVFYSSPTHLEISIPIATTH